MFAILSNTHRKCYLESICMNSLRFLLFVLGIVNRGDSFRRRRSRSNSLCPQTMGGMPSPVLDQPDRTHHIEVTKYTVALVGSQGVGKTALISQFMTSECINAYDSKKGKNLFLSVSKKISFCFA